MLILISRTELDNQIAYLFYNTDYSYIHPDKGEAFKFLSYNDTVSAILSKTVANAKLENTVVKPIDFQIQSLNSNETAYYVIDINTDIKRAKVVSTEKIILDVDFEFLKRHKKDLLNCSVHKDKIRVNPVSNKSYLRYVESIHTLGLS